MKLVKLSIVALAMGMFVASCGSSDATNENADSTPVEAPMETPAEAPMTDSTTAPMTDSAAAPATTATPEAAH